MQKTQLPWKPSQIAAKPVLVITLLNIRICFEFRASDFEFGSGLFGLGEFEI